MPARRPARLPRGDRTNRGALCFCARHSRSHAAECQGEVPGPSSCQHVRSASARPCQRASERASERACVRVCERAHIRARRGGQGVDVRQEHGPSSSTLAPSNSPRCLSSRKALSTRDAFHSSTPSLTSSLTCGAPHRRPCEGAHMQQGAVGAIGSSATRARLRPLHNLELRLRLWGRHGGGSEFVTPSGRKHHGEGGAGGGTVGSMAGSDGSSSRGTRPVVCAWELGAAAVRHRARRRVARRLQEAGERRPPGKHHLAMSAEQRVRDGPARCRRPKRVCGYLHSEPRAGVIGGRGHRLGRLFRRLSPVSAAARPPAEPLDDGDHWIRRPHGALAGTRAHGRTGTRAHGHTRAHTGTNTHARGCTHARTNLTRMRVGALTHAQDQLAFSNAKNIQSISSFGAGTWRVSGASPTRTHTHTHVSEVLQFLVFVALSSVQACMP